MPSPQPTIQIEAVRTVGRDQDGNGLEILEEAGA
jgi:hypothetical protein